MTDPAGASRVRFLHTSDWQLGMTRHYLAGEAQARFTGDRVEAIRRIGRVARDEGCEFVVVAGDVFEHANLGRRDVVRALGAMGEVGLPVYLLPGNHDPLGPGSIWESAAFDGQRPDNVILLDRPGPWPVREGVEIVAAPWFTKHPDHDPVTDVLSGLTADGTTRVLVGHGMLDALEPDRDTVAVDTDRLRAAVAAGIVHYVALGDRHIRWPAEGQPDATDGPIHYSGTPETTGFREPGRGTVLTVRLSPDERTVTAHEIGRWLHTVVTADLSGPADVDALAARLDAFNPKERVIVKTVLRGTLNLTESARLEDLLARYGDAFAALNAWERHTDLVVTPDDAEFDDLALGGYVLDAVAELTSTVDRGGEQADRAGEALKLLHRLAGGVR